MISLRTADLDRLSGMAKSKETGGEEEVVGRGPTSSCGSLGPRFHQPTAPPTLLITPNVQAGTLHGSLLPG